MKKFMDADFLLQSDAAKTIYHDYAENMPILDYHCHISPKEIAEDRHFENIAQVWLGGDHYKWRLMRAFGVDEKYITGDASDKDKFLMFAKCLGKAVGNPLYHWAHLELRKYFGYDGVLNEKTAEEVYDLCNKVLQAPDMGARKLIKMSDVTLICTTDDPIDTLEWHDKIKADSSFDVKVLPAWRPDKAMNITKPDFVDYIGKLSEVSGVKISSFKDLKEALKIRLDYFGTKGCNVTDHALEYVMYRPATDDEVEAIFAKRIKGETVSYEESLKFQTAFMLFEGAEIAKRDWVMQLHFGCKRDNNTAMYEKLGPDTGYDTIGAYYPMGELADFLDALQKTGSLPKTILYSLNPNDNKIINTTLNAFNEGPAVAKIQQGSAWWFNDTKLGMEEQLQCVAESGNLSGFVGMLTDSRSFTSYTRHDYFRRILCNYLGSLVDNGEFPESEIDTLGKIAADISYNNAVRYFKFPLEVR
ncbi:glucuronate isomerase [Butyrivibrio sp. INlla18]|uniref:glucuronate isomerase n=1 Tax=Butyrivibrio sp. INlla18 TaxID=1520806 RepID=UPI000886496D|nr:glucuronate isomerase [Butyrivibrio sp. INlla18]SDA68059.1 glucuronate isomerase [Butyrivibrio sp. INlla18]